MNKPNEKTEKKKTKEESKREVGPRRPLLRSKDDRMIWGVAGGLAQHLNVDAILVRLGFVVATFFGGTGVLAYLVLAVALPEDDGTGNPKHERLSDRLVRVVLVCLLVAAGLAVAGGLAGISAWATATGHGVVIAGVVIAVGIALAGTAFVGDFRRIGPWLLTTALVLAIPAGAVAAADVRFDESVGQREYRPATIADLPADGYELGTGQLIVDLRDLPWETGQVVPLSTKLGIGQMIVSVPSTVCVDAHAMAKGGELLVRGDESRGIDPDVNQPTPRTQAPILQLNAEQQFGQMIVTDQDPDSISDHGADYDHNQEEADSEQAACGR
jgi:phage shock protein PspC (stress-responsive transcriptional regulator)